MKPVLILAGAEFQEGLRNRWVLSAVLLLATLAFSLALLGSAPIGETRVSTLNVTTISLASLSVYLIPLIALTLTYDAIIGERERGTLLLLLTYPITRTQVILGKFLGHFAIITLALTVGYGATGLYLATIGNSAPADWKLFSSMLATSILLGSVFLGMGYLISVCVSSRATAAGVAITVWLFVVVIYDLLLLGLVLVDSEHAMSANVFSLLLLLNPADVYRLYNLAGSEAASLVSGSFNTLDSPMLSGRALVTAMALWVALPLWSSIWIFKRHEL